MDFAELNDLEIYRFTERTYQEKLKNNFSAASEQAIRSAEYEYSNSAASLGGTLLKAVPLVGTAAVVLDKARDFYSYENRSERWNGAGQLIHEKINQRFSNFVDHVNQVMKQAATAFQLKVQTMAMEIQDKDATIANLTVELDQLKQMLQQENEVVTTTLQAHPPIKQALQDYQNNPRVPLSTDQQTIARLVVEIKKINYDLRLAISNNRSLKHQVQEWRKKYHDKEIIEEQVQKIQFHNIQLQQENHRLAEQVNYLANLVKDLQVQRSRLSLEEKPQPPFTGWLSKHLGLNDFYTSVKDFLEELKGFFQGTETLAYVYLLFISVNQFLKWLAHWQLMPYKLYAVLIFPLIIFLIYRLSKY